MCCTRFRSNADASYKTQVTEVQGKLEKLLQDPAQAGADGQLQQLRQQLQAVIIGM